MVWRSRALHAVDANGIVVEKVRPLRQRKVLSGGVEGVVDGVETVAQRVDWIVAREHRALSAEELDDRQGRRTLRRSVEVAEPGDLDHHVVALGKLRHCAAPGTHLR